MATQAMSFEAFKTSVFALSRRNQVSHLIPNSNVLFRLWELQRTPENVVQFHCTKDACKLRHTDVDEYHRTMVENHAS